MHALFYRELFDLEIKLFYFQASEIPKREDGIAEWWSKYYIAKTRAKTGKKDVYPKVHFISSFICSDCLNLHLHVLFYCFTDL